MRGRLKERKKERKKQMKMKGETANVKKTPAEQKSKILHEFKTNRLLDKQQEKPQSGNLIYFGGGHFILRSHVLLSKLLSFLAITSSIIQVVMINMRGKSSA